MRPQHQHDCEKCLFLGTFEEYDLYVDDDPGGVTLVARYGDDGPEYMSAPLFVVDIMKSSEHMQMAKRRALELGVLPSDPCGKVLRNRYGGLAKG